MFLSHLTGNSLKVRLTYNSFLGPLSEFCSALHHEHILRVVDLDELGNAAHGLEV